MFEINIYNVNKYFIFKWKKIIIFFNFGSLLHWIKLIGIPQNLYIPKCHAFCKMFTSFLHIHLALYELGAWHKTWDKMSEGGTQNRTQWNAYKLYHYQLTNNCKKLYNQRKHLSLCMNPNDIMAGALFSIIGRSCSSFYF